MYLTWQVIYNNNKGGYKLLKQGLSYGIFEIFDICSLDGSKNHLGTSIIIRHSVHYGLHLIWSCPDHNNQLAHDIEKWFRIPYLKFAVKMLKHMLTEYDTSFVNITYNDDFKVSLKKMHIIKLIRA